MKLSLLHQPAAPASASPYRLVDEHGQEVTWVNGRAVEYISAFLDADSDDGNPTALRESEVSLPVRHV